MTEAAVNEYWHDCNGGASKQGLSQQLVGVRSARKYSTVLCLCLVGHVFVTLVLPMLKSHTFRRSTAGKVVTMSN